MQHYKWGRKNGKSVGLHRVIMEKIIGRDLLPNEHVHHVNGDTFDNRPENLQIVDPETHGRLSMTLKGEQHGSSKLKQVDVKMIRQLQSEGYSIKRLALMFDVSESCIYFVYSGRTWK